MVCFVSEHQLAPLENINCYVKEHHLSLKREFEDYLLPETEPNTRMPNLLSVQ
jgi:hypothetical protein